MQRFGFALPLSLVTSVSFIVMIIVCILRENNPCAFHGFIGDYLFFTIPKINALAASSLQWQCLLWLLILLSQVWTTAHIWTSHCERLATTHRIFALPFYDSLIIDQSLMLNRRKDNFLNHKKSNKVLSSVFNKYMFWITSNEYNSYDSIVPISLTAFDSRPFLFLASHSIQKKVLSLLQSWL